MIDQEQKYYIDYCNVEKRNTKFVTDSRGVKAVCCTCSYAKEIDEDKLTDSVVDELNLEGKVFKEEKDWYEFKKCLKILKNLFLL